MSNKTQPKWIIYRKKNPPIKILRRNIEIDSQSGCWLWIGYKDKNGYGRLTVNSEPLGAHRLSYLLFNGEIPVGSFVCHRCDNPSCVNPKHLFIGSVKDNTIDSIKKGRSAIQKLTIEQVLKIRKSKLSIKELSKKYNVSAHTIYSIMEKITWSWLN